MSELGVGMWTPFNVSTSKHLKSLEDESYREATQLYKEHPQKATKILTILINDLNFRKLLCDLYVWHRVEAIIKGINRAKEESKLSDIKRIET